MKGKSKSHGLKIGLPLLYDGFDRIIFFSQSMKIILFVTLGLYFNTIDAKVIPKSPNVERILKSMNLDDKVKLTFP